MNYLGVMPYFVRVFIYNIIHSIVNYIGIYFISVLNTPLGMQMLFLEMQSQTNLMMC